VKSEGYSVLELLMVVSVSIVISGAAIPLANNGVDRTRAAGAVRYVAGRMASARFEAVRRSAYVAIQFVQHGDGFWLRTYVDGNRNGVLSGDITRGIDTPLTPDERLDHHFPGITFGILPNVTGLDPGQPFNAGDPVQIGLRRCSASVHWGRRRRARCLFAANGARSSRCGCWAPPAVHAHSSSTSEKPDGKDGSRRAPRGAASVAGRRERERSGTPSTRTVGAHRQICRP
jgi:hypothetical protein